MLVELESPTPGDFLDPAGAFAGPFWAEVEEDLGVADATANGLASGKRLGNYVIREAIGAGGMGQVYRAHHAELDREVAIKALPQAFALVPERIKRFRQEARVLARLNHPNIATLHELVTVGENPYLVLELVPGETLGDRIKRSGALRTDEVLRIAHQLASALEDAHLQGIVHRDLKPANVMVTPEGGLKVLDFGLAKPLQEKTDHSTRGHATETEATQITRSGTILGTTAYMSPEQAAGDAVDHTSDIWAFGCILFEMLTGRSPFLRPEAADTLGAILRDEPNWAELPEATPLELVELIKRCLVKEPSVRLRDISLASIKLVDIGDGGSPDLERLRVGGPAEAAGRLRGNQLGWTVAAAASALAILLAAVSLSRTVTPRKSSEAALPGDANTATTSSSEATVLAVNLPAELELSRILGMTLALSPGGDELVFVGYQGDRSWLYHRPLDRLDARPIPGTEGAIYPALSPGGQSLAFFANGVIRRTSFGGNSPAQAEAFDVARVGGGVRGLDWLHDGRIVYAPLTGGLKAVDSHTGDEQSLTLLSQGSTERSHRWPQALPDGRHVLFTVDYDGATFDEAALHLLDLESGTTRELVSDAAYGRAARDGRLVYANGGRLYRAQFDLASDAPSSTPTPLVNGVLYDPRNGGSHFAVGDTGTLAWVPSPPRRQGRQLVWLSTDGAVEAFDLPARRYRLFSLSQDGERLAIGIGGALDTDLWLVDLASGTVEQLTSNLSVASVAWGEADRELLLTAGGRADTAGDRTWQLLAIDPSSREQRTLIEDFSRPIRVQAHLDDGRAVIAALDQTSGWDLLAIDGERSEPEALVSTPANETRAAVSPDGRWLAFESDAFSDYIEVYIQSLVSGRRTRVSGTVARAPRFDRQGRLIYWQPAGEDSAFRRVTFDSLAENFTPEGDLEILRPRDPEWRHLVPPSWGGFEVDPTGERFLVLREHREAPSSEPLRILIGEGLLSP